MWSQLGKAQLQQNMVKEAIDSYIKVTALYFSAHNYYSLQLNCWFFKFTFPSKSLSYLSEIRRMPLALAIIFCSVYFPVILLEPDFF